MPRFELLPPRVAVGREPVERDPLYNVLSRGLAGATDVETQLSNTRADLIQPRANLGITQREGVTTASQTQKERARELIAGS